MRLTVNLSLRPVETNRRFKVVFGGLGTIAVLFFITLGWHVVRIRKADSTFRLQRDQAASEIARLSAQRQVLDNFFNLPENARLHDNANFVNSIVDARSFNWTRMFMALEKVLPDGVRVLNIEPKQISGQAAVKMTVSATSEDAKIKFLNALEQSGVFSHLQLTSVRANEQGDSSGQLILEVTVVYSRA